MLKLDAADGGAPLLTVFGGKITTYRRLAEAALEKLAPICSARSARGLDRAAPLPGGDFAVDRLRRRWSRRCARDYPFLERGACAAAGPRSTARAPAGMLGDAERRWPISAASSAPT